MKILHVAQCYYPALGGVEGLVKNLSEQLVARYMDEVTVFTAATYNAETFWRIKGPVLTPGIEQVNGVKVHRFKVFNDLQLLRMFIAHGFRRFNLPYNDWARTIQTGPLIFNFAKAIANSGVDIIFATSFPFLHMYYALAGAKRADIPIIFLGAIHVTDEWGYDRKMMYEAIQQVDAYIALTNFERDHLFQYGIHPDKIKVIGGGVAVKSFLNADGTNIKKKFGWGDDPVVAAIARQSPLKRLDLLLQAMPIVWAEQPDVRLLMAGARTSYSPQLDRLINALPPKQQANIAVIHNFSEDEKPKLLAASDILVHPSSNESFGIVFIEAWACGKPVIGARIGSIPSLIVEGIDGLLFDHKDPRNLAHTILKLIKNPQRGIKMGEAGQRKVLENYTWEIVADRLRSVYTEVILSRQAGSN